MDLIAGSVALGLSAISAGVHMVNIKKIKALEEAQAAHEKELKVYGGCIAAMGLATIFERYRSYQQLKNFKLEQQEENNRINRRMDSLESDLHNVSVDIADIKRCLGQTA